MNHMRIRITTQFIEWMQLTSSQIPQSYYHGSVEDNVCLLTKIYTSQLSIGLANAFWQSTANILGAVLLLLYYK